LVQLKGIISVTDTVERVLSGDIRTAARLISDIDNGVPGVRQVLKKIYPHTGNAYVVGITGAPGVGKSTLVDRMLSHLRREEKTVGIIAIDPTSPFSGGALLGDRVRMQRHSNDEGVFIRSLATRGHFGGLTQSTRSAIDVLDAMGKDYIIVETVGVGQDEVEIVKSAHTTVIVLIPGMGDDIQAIKAGILEAGDIFVINKSDKEGSDNTLNDLRTMLDMDINSDDKTVWIPPVLKTEAIADRGLKALPKEVENHRMHLAGLGGDLNLRRRRDRVRDELSEMIKDRIIREVLTGLIEDGEFDKAVDSVVRGEKDPYTVSDELVRRRISISGG
jgi:LAO/AO transport system kinase